MQISPYVFIVLLFSFIGVSASVQVTDQLTHPPHAPSNRVMIDGSANFTDTCKEFFKKLILNFNKEYHKTATRMKQVCAAEMAVRYAALCACRKVHVCHCNSLGGAT